MAPRSIATRPGRTHESHRRRWLIGILAGLGLLYLIGGVGVAVYFLAGNQAPPSSAVVSSWPLPTAPIIGLPPGAIPDRVKPPHAASDDSWTRKLTILRENGLDLVICFDSTGSMGGEISQLKLKIARIGTTLLDLVPSARVSICTYRDASDEYVVRGVPLTSDIKVVEKYLQAIRAAGGGDAPEAVHEGLRWSVDSNLFRKEAVKVILLFGDAPPHRQHLAACLRIAGDFHQKQAGIVSTVTCRTPRMIAEFEEIARAGGGESFLVKDHREIVEQLVILVFGSEHRDKVIEAFKLLDR